MPTYQEFPSNDKFLLFKKLVFEKIKFEKPAHYTIFNFNFVNNK